MNREQRRRSEREQRRRSKSRRFVAEERIGAEAQDFMAGAVLARKSGLLTVQGQSSLEDDEGGNAVFVVVVDPADHPGDGPLLVELFAKRAALDYTRWFEGLLAEIKWACLVPASPETGVRPMARLDLRFHRPVALRTSILLAAWKCVDALAVAAEGGLLALVTPEIEALAGKAGQSAWEVMLERAVLLDTPPSAVLEELVDQLGTGRARSAKTPPERVQVSSAVREAVGGEAAQALIDAFRTEGGNCVICAAPVRPSDRASLVVISASDDPPLPAFVRVAHARCSPSVVLAPGSPTPAGVAALWDRLSDVVFWPFLRQDAEPRAVLIVEHQLLFGGDPGAEVTALALKACLEAGFSIAAPPVAQLNLPEAPNLWVERKGSSLALKNVELHRPERDEDVAFEGDITAPREWWKALEAEGTCGFLMGVNTGLAAALAKGNIAALAQLDEVARRGNLVGASVRVGDREPDPPSLALGSE